MTEGRLRFFLFLAGSPAHGGSADPTTRIVGRATIFFYVHPSVPAQTLKEFVEHARANPGKLNYGTGNALSILYTHQDRKSTRLNSSHIQKSRMPSSA